VLISSHLLAEVEQTIDQVVIISRGQTMYYGRLDELRKSQQSRVIVQPADPGKLATALQKAEITNIQPMPDGKVAVVGATVQQIGDVAAQSGLALYGVQEEKADLEQLFFRLTSGQYAAPGMMPPGQPPQVPPGGYAQPVGQPPQQAYQQQGYQQPQGSGYHLPVQGYQQPGQQQYPQQPGYQPQQGTPPGGWAPPSGPQPTQQQPGTPPGGWGPPPPQDPGQQQQQQPQQPGQGGTGGNA
jgi:ABC-2 type transport system ATP-binding protein